MGKTANDPLPAAASDLALSGFQTLRLSCAATRKAFVDVLKYVV